MRNRPHPRADDRDYKRGTERDDELDTLVPPTMRPQTAWRLGLIALAVLVAILFVMQGGWWPVQVATGP